MSSNSIRCSPLDAWVAKEIGTSTPPISCVDIQSYQLDRINRIIPYVKKNSRYFREALKLFPDQVGSLEEFTRFPFTTGDTLREIPEKLICVSQQDIARVVTFNTSGTTGKPKRCFFTQDDLELTVDFFGTGMSTLVSPGDRVLILLPDKTPDSVGDLLYRGLERIGAIPFKHGPVHDLDETLGCMCANRVNALVGVPTQVLALARYQESRSKEFPVHIKSILLSTDYVPEAIVSVLETVWGCAVYNHYGMTEMGLGGGVFCSGRYGYHLREADMYFEIIDPQTGKNLPDGQTGEVVFTTLTRTGMPLIRYRTGDYSRFLPEKCPCGSDLKSLEKISGRIGNEYSINGRSYRISDFDEALFPLKGLINYKLSFTRTQEVDDLHFRLFFLDQPAFIPSNELESRLNRIGINTNNVAISTETITGFPEELSSLAKRKIVENWS
jgi:phenylacetate-coenzyme A ligase PaaK-like adenylate-forming protein